MVTKKRGGDSARLAGGRSRLGVSRAALVGMVAIALLVVGLTGCALNGTVAGPTPAGTVNSGGTPGAHATLTLPTLAATASPSGVAGQQGVKEFCSKAPSIEIHPGSNIPVYSDANLNFSQANGSNAFYGYCTGDSTSAVQDFYAQQLPKQGWIGLQTSTIAAVVQITASQCASQNAPKIIVTIAPDTSGATTTSISIVVLAGSC